MSGRGFKLGRKHVTQDEYDKSILDLISQGLSQKDIAARMNVNKKTIERSVKRSGSKLKDQALAVGVDNRMFQQLSVENFAELPDLAQWIEGLRVRRVKNKPNLISKIKRVCDELQIFPSMLDIDYAMKFLAMHEELELRQLRSWKLALRSFLTGSGRATGEQCRAHGIDAKHHGDGEYAQVLLSEEQIMLGHTLLTPYPRALAIFDLGVECCPRRQDFLIMSRDSFVDIEGFTILRYKSQKTGAYWSKFPSRKTIDEWRALEIKGKDGKIFTELEITDEIIPQLKAAYIGVGATNPYFTLRPLHSLRHIGAQRLLRKTNWNRAIVARLGGWEAEKALEDHYGAVPDEIVRTTGLNLWK